MNQSKTVGTCPMCQRETGLTFHHLIPKKLHRRNRFKKQFTREELNQGIYICRTCHSGIHNLYDEMTLGSQYSSLESLLADSAVQRHVAWVAKQKVR
ncbi:hypothetical protein [Pontibacter sp. G13]|uniref:hypothetical protein n=1 Tax=Pontibacter sp. G13 TaxID=3074898 RepID=UPI0028898A7D|nr:hypothetical protein [Pontibacter sp. G13]WNJ17308.1 hypothetical protein RJD25_20860 [Pontibacter sp. G13]